MTQQKDDCYFFYYSTCIKGASCPFRHEPAALGREDTCAAWLKGTCQREACPDRHMIINKNRSQTPCFWESQPGGCQKPHCVFFHRKNMVAVQPKATASEESIQKSEPVTTEATTTLKVEKKNEEPVSTSPTKPKQVVGAAAAIQKTVEPQSSPVATETRVLSSGVRKVKAVSEENAKNADEERVVPQETKKIILKRDVAKKVHVTERIGRVSVVNKKDSDVDSGEDGLLIKSLEQIHREKALASMKEKALASMKKKQQDVPLEQQNGSTANGESKVSPSGRKIVIKREMKSDGELSDSGSASSQDRRTESKSDAEGSCGGRSRPVVDDVVVPPLRRSGESLGRVRLEPAVPEARKRRSADDGVVAPLRLFSKVSRMALQSGAKAAKPEMEIYRPPRALNSQKESKQLSLSPRAAAVEVERVRPREDPLTRKRADLLTMLSKASEEKKTKKMKMRKEGEEEGAEEKAAVDVVSLKRPRLAEKSEIRRPLEEVKVKTLDEILAEKRKKKQGQQLNGKSEAAAPRLRSDPSAEQNEATADVSNVHRKRIAAVQEPTPASGSDHSLSHLLKRRRMSMENAKVTSEVEDRAGVPEKAEKAVSPVAEEREEKVTTKEAKKDIASLSFSIDDESLEEFLLGDEGDGVDMDSHYHNSINDDELFKEIQSLL